MDGPSTTISSADIISQLRLLPRSVQLSKVLRLLSEAHSGSERYERLTVHAWTFLVENELWTASSMTLQDVKDAINWPKVSERINAHNETQKRRTRDLKGIQKHWSSSPEDLLPADIRPPYLSSNLLKYLHRLSKACPWKTADELLRSMVERRLKNSYEFKAVHVQVSDVMLAVKEAERQAGSMGNIRGVGTSGVDHDGRHWYGACGKYGEGSGVGGATLGEVSEIDGALTGQVGTAENGSHPIKDEEACRAEFSEDDCYCPVSLRGLISRLRVDMSDMEGLSLLKEISAKTKLIALCRNHLRSLAGDGLGLLNNKKNICLCRRLQLISQSQPLSQSKLHDLRIKRPRWFRRSHRPAVPQDLLGTCRYDRIPHSDFDFDPILVFERFAGVGAWDSWVADGTIIIPNIFKYLEEAGLQELIDEEFAIYRHHHYTPSGTSRLGWLRNMYFSLLQQLARQDPIWYALTAAARPDRGWRLISYPYITKDTGSKGETTGFLHMDVNLEAFLGDGRGGSRLTSSLSIDNEDSSGCTIVVKGLHHHLQEWHKRLLLRGQNISGPTTNCKHIYTAEDQATWGKPTPTPCPAWGIRLTLPQVIHGSTPCSVQRRRTILPWYMHIDSDHEKLEIPGCLSWSEIRQCHLDLEVPSRDPSGYGPRLGAPRERFGGSVVLQSVSALGDALVGRRKWTDIEVLRERDILLGPNSQAAIEYARGIRTRLVEQYRASFSSMEQGEKEQFGKNSYFFIAARGKENLVIVDGSNDSTVSMNTSSESEGED